MERRIQWKISAGAAVAFALLWFFDADGLVAATVPAVLAHELGHAAALRLCGARLRRVSVGLAGIEINYVNLISRGRTALSLAAGPAAGLIYALTACRFGGEYLRLSGAVSFVLTIFNLLPVLPLDGGRLVAELTDEALAGTLSRVASLLLLAGGAALLFAYRAPALFAAGLWLTACNFRSPNYLLC